MAKCNVIHKNVVGLSIDFIDLDGVRLISYD